VLAAGLRSNCSPRASQALKGIDAALRRHSLEDSLRLLDRAWRSIPEATTLFAPVYGYVLLLDGQDDYAALGLLRRALEFGPDADAMAASAVALLRLERYDDARERLHAALSDYCVVPGSLLFHAAGAIALHPAVGAPGWVGRGPRLQLLGELAPGQSATVLDIALAGEPSFSQLLPRAVSHDQRQAFSVRAPTSACGVPLEVHARGVPLAGSSLRLPPAFALDGRATSKGDACVSGWARLGWHPQQRLSLRIEDDCGQRALVHTRTHRVPGVGTTFELKLREFGLRGGILELAAHLPDGRWCGLPDSPLLLERVIKAPRGGRMRLGKWHAAPARAAVPMPAAACTARTDIIIPVYRGREETLACIHSVLGTIGTDAQVVVVDDATEDAALAATLDELAAEQRIILLRNATNRGFIASVNRALALNPTHDVVLLNSDTLVFEDWLARLRAAAYSARRVGTVTPLSNAGSIVSYPYVRGAEVSAEFAAALHAVARATHADRRAEIPVGVGFCLYIRRDCLNSIGTFDPVYGKGYGEEVDFCLRARRAGWNHQLAADVFVYHAGGVSFGSRRAALLERSQRILNLRYPGYDPFIASFEAQDPLRTVRRRLDEHRLSAFQGRFVLLVSCAMKGGVERFVNERCREIRAQNLYPLILRPAVSGETAECELWTDALEVPNLRFTVAHELPALTALLGVLRLEAIEIQHFLHLDARVVEAVRALPLPYDVFVHDYAWLCPRVTLIDGSGRYCGEPAVPVCQRCVRRNGSYLGETISVPVLRARSDTWLRGARRVRAPSADTAQRFQRHFPGLQVHVQPHAASSPPTSAGRLYRGKSTRRVARIALLGAIGDHKGYEVLLACARDARARALPIEFVVIGYTRDDAPLLATGRVFVTGRYTDSEPEHLLRRERPDLIWLPSVWPETWCYTLDHALDAMLPVVSFDLGAIAERLRAAGTGELLPLDSTPPSINDHFIRLLKSPAAPVAAAPHSVQSRPPEVCADDKMQRGSPSETPMKKNETESKPLSDVREQGMSASIQLLPLPQGLYLFSVKAAAPFVPQSNGEITLPAVHVGLGPGVRPEQVEFIAGPSTHGAWLFAPGDLLVTKVNQPGATLVMTSVRAPGGEVLSIRVERLESRTEAADRPPALAAAAVHASGAAEAKPLVPVHIGVHVRSRGDMTFTDAPWAGRVAPGLWIESYSVRPQEGLAGSDLEYKALTGSGFETPWMSDEKMCGTKGMAVPLVGFAVRLKSGASAAGYDLEYSGYFQSGVTVGPLRNGAPCRSTVANDPLEGIQVRLLRRGNGTDSKTTKGARRAKERSDTAVQAPTQRVSSTTAQAARRP